MTLGISDPIRVTDDAGNAAPAVTLNVTATGYAGSTVVTNAQGMTQLVDLPLGLYTITNPITGRSVAGVPVNAKPSQQETTIAQAATGGVIPDGSIQVVKLAFDPATQAELDAGLASKRNLTPQTSHDFIDAVTGSTVRATVVNGALRTEVIA